MEENVRLGGIQGDAIPNTNVGNPTQQFTLRGKEVYEQIVIIDKTPQVDKNNMEFWRVSFRGRALILREDAFNALAEGNMASINFIPTEFVVERTDPETGLPTGQTEKMTGWQYSGHLSYDTAKTVARNEGELKRIENSFIEESNYVNQ